MMDDSPENDPDMICRLDYLTVARECSQYGLAPDQILKSSQELSQYLNDRYYLRDTAYRPTGIALGCPLPDAGVTNHLWQITQWVDDHLKSICPGEEKTLAFVPPDSYHITLVNRSHFESISNITPITEDEKNRSQQVITQRSEGTIHVQLNGLILSKAGRLIVPGYPGDNKLYKIRKSLADFVPELRVNVPKTAHIKLGHVLVPLDRQQIESFLNRLGHCGEEVNFRLSFTDVYTPRGRILL